MKSIFLSILILILSISLPANFMIIESAAQPEHDAIPPDRNAVLSTDGNTSPLSPSESEEESPVFLNPPHPIRPHAEFGTSSGALIRYPLGIPLELVRVLSLEDRVVTIVASNAVRTQATTAFINANVNMDNVEFIIASTDSFWTRDYGPWFSYDESGSLNVINFTYNRPRPSDNAINAIYATFDSLPIYSLGITHCGGNYMTDGISIAASSHIAYTENGNNSTYVNQQMYNFLGIDEYHVVQDPNNTYIDHIDCWGKFLSPDTILIRSVPTTHPRYQALEATAAYFSGQMSSWGRSFNVVRVHTPENQPYTNSFIINDRVFVPQMGSTWDAPALQTYADAMPGYTIIGVMNNTNNPWVSTDAIHCRIKELAERDVIFIDHMPIAREITILEDTLEITAEIQSTTSNPFNPDEIKVFYKINQGDYQFENMVLNNLEYTASISGIADQDTLYYYIRVEDSVGLVGQHPYIGEAWAHWTVVTVPVSISEEPILPVLELTVYPNPFYLNNDSNMRIEVVGDNENEIGHVSMYNIRGQKIFEENMKDYINLDITRLNLSSGIYFLRYSNKGNVSVRRITIM